MADFNEEVGRQIGGNQSRRVSDIRSSFRVDTQQLSDLKKQITELRDVTMSWRKEMEKLAEASKGINMGGGKVGGAGTPEPAGSNTNKPVNSSQAATKEGFFARNAERIGKAGAVAGAIGMVTRQVDARIDRGIAYATSADRLNLLTQQMTGMSQMQVMQSRQASTQYRLGAGGQNALSAFAAQTGQRGIMNMGAGIESLRMASGFSKSTADILTEQQQLMDPNVVNRLMFMTGVNVYETGTGQMRDPMKIRQEIARNTGLTGMSAQDLQTSLRAGSAARVRLADMGLGEQFQTSILQYAAQNAQFREQGGRGMYDPSNRQHQQRMGISENLATQQEETERVTSAREEQFMIRNIDNMAALEKSNQMLIEAMGRLEDTLSGAVGGRISSRSFARSGGGFLKGAGGALLASGAAAQAVPGAGTAAGVPLMAIGGALLGLGAMLGDPVAGDGAQDGMTAGGSSASGQSAKSSANDSNIMVPYGYGEQRISLTQLKGKSQFANLHSRFKSRLLEMMRVNPNVGLGGGTRDSNEQEKMFLSRYSPTDEDTGLFWRGTFWEHKSGAAAAPPGRSFHEIGLAADLVGDLEWMNANASRFGLRHFADVNNEPWHVQPAELPGARSKYEQQGAPWGTDGRYQEELNWEGSTPGMSRSRSSDHGSSSTSGSFGLTLPTGQSLTELYQSASAQSVTRMLTNKGTYARASTSKRSGGSRTVTAGSGAQAAAAAAYRAGFRGDDLTKIVAIAGRESGWNPNAKNPNTSDHGMWQINWSANGDLAKSLGAKNAEDLFDLNLNAKVAYALYNNAKGWAKGKNPGFHPWRASDTGWENNGPGWDGNGNEMWRTDKYLAEATAATDQYRSGDPIAPTKASGRSGGSGAVTNNYSSSPTVHVSPVINFNGTPQSQDLRSIANSVAKLIKQEVDMMDLRTA